MSGGGGRTRPRHVERWWPNAAAPCRAVAAERGRVMSGGGGRTWPRHVGQWRPNAAASCRVVAAAECGRAMSGSGGRTRPRHVGRWRLRAAAPCRVALMGHGRSLQFCLALADLCDDCKFVIMPCASASHASSVFKNLMLTSYRAVYANLVCAIADVLLILHLLALLASWNGIKQLLWVTALF